MNVRLFSCIGAPKYRVVVGVLLRPLNQIPFSAKPLYTIDIEGAIPFRDGQPLVGRIGEDGANRSISSNRMRAKSAMASTGQYSLFFFRARQTSETPVNKAKFHHCGNYSTPSLLWSQVHK